MPAASAINMALMPRDISRLSLCIVATKLQKMFEGECCRPSVGTMSPSRISVYIVSFRQGCEASLCKIEAVAEGRLCGDVISKQGVHVIADAIAQIVADSAHTFQPVD